MSQDELGAELLEPLFRFAWALTGDKMTAAALTQKVIGHAVWHRAQELGARAAEVALFSVAFQIFTSGVPIPIPPVHDRVAIMSQVSLQLAESATLDSLLESFRELKLPQRAALVLFYTTQCSLHDIAAVLQWTSDETVSILSRGKAEWLHILHRSGKSGGESPEGDAP